MAKPVQANQLVADVCADCGSPGAGWASLNRGVVMCDECCSLHRSLGRHVSQVVSLRKGNIMTASKQQMLIQLINGGANLIWEYALLDPANNGAWQKPTPKDALSKKEKFIREKYVVHAFCQRPTDPNVTRDDLSKQLHASVRTNNIETSLRLLALGADVNYVHPERGTSPLHVAVQANRSLQVELLLVYGADALARDSTGKTPLDLARELARSATASNANGTTGGYSGSSHGSGSIVPVSEMELRLLDSVFEITDRLSVFLSGRKPDHSKQTIVVPEISPDKVDMSELAMEARIKLQSLPDRLFEELLIDAFDEADRREVEVSWTALTTPVFRKGCPPIVFLPVCHAYSATRNQARQKLGRLSEREWNTLVLDCVREARARFRAADWRIEMVQRAEMSHDGDLERIPSDNDSPVDELPTRMLPGSNLDDRRSRGNELAGDQPDEDHFYHDHEPVYDQVPVELDYVKVSNENLYLPTNTSADKAPVELDPKRMEGFCETSLDSPLDLPAGVDPAIDIARAGALNEAPNEEGMVMISAEQFLVLKRSLEAAESRIHDLISENKQLQFEVDSLQQNMLQLVEENAGLRNALQQLSVTSSDPTHAAGLTVKKGSLPAVGSAQITLSQSLTFQGADAAARDGASREHRDTFVLTSSEGASQLDSGAGAKVAEGNTSAAKGDAQISPAAAPLTVSTSSSAQLAVVTQSGTPLSSPSNAIGPGATCGVLGASGGDSVARYTDALAKQLRDLVKAVNDGSSTRYAILCNAVDVNVKEMCAAFLSALNEDALDDTRWREIQQCVTSLQDGARELKDSAANIVQQRRASFTASASSANQPDASVYANADWANQVKAHFLIYTMGKALRSFIACLNK